MRLPAAYLLPMITAVALLSGPCPARGDSEVSTVRLPFAPAPTGQWGGAFSGEYDSRYVGSNLARVQRALYRLGGTPVGFASIWVEAGIASLRLTGGGKSLQGDFGTALGTGWTLAWVDFPYFGLLPFASGRATYLQSRLSDDREVSPGVVREVRSRYEWREAFGLLGLSLTLKGLEKSAPARSVSLFGGMALRALFQDEFRHTRTGAVSGSHRVIYKSGVKPGLMLGAELPLKARFSLWVAGEKFRGAERVTISIGQWGAVR